MAGGLVSKSIKKMAGLELISVNVNITIRSLKRRNRLEMLFKLMSES